MRLTVYAHADDDSAPMTQVTLCERLSESVAGTEISKRKGVAAGIEAILFLAFKGPDTPIEPPTIGGAM